jgi:thiol-disulfide isomerase/thioredoxin
MKFFILLLLVLVNALVFSQTAADSLVNSITKQASNQKKNVLLKFSASWCGWCHKMDAALQDAKVKPIVDKYYLYSTLVVMEGKEKKYLETSGGGDYLKKYEGEKSGLPYWVILDGTGAILANSKRKNDTAPLTSDGDNVGCPAEKDEVDYFIRVLQATSKITSEEINIVRQRFLLNRK